MKCRLGFVWRLALPRGFRDKIGGDRNAVASDWLFSSNSGIEVTTMGKGNNSQSKEKKKPKKAAAPKAVPAKASPPPKKS